MELRENRANRRAPLIWAGVAAGVAFWLADSAVDAALFGHATFLQSLLAPGARELHMRLLVLGLAVALGARTRVLCARAAEPAQTDRSREVRYERILNAAGEGLIALGPDGSVVLGNPAAARLLGYAPGALQGMHQHEIICDPGAANPRPSLHQLCTVCLPLTRDGSPAVGEAELRRADGSVFRAGFVSTPVLDGDRLDGAVVCFRERAERTVTERRSARLNRLLALVSAVNRLIVRARERQGLLEAVCRSAADAGGFALAWAGLVDPESGALRLGPHSGGGDADARVALVRQFLEQSNGPLQRVIGEGVRVVCNDPLRAFPNPPWARPALEVDLRSCALLPLRCGRRLVGLLALYAAEADYFEEDAVELLDGLAEDVLVRAAGDRAGRASPACRRGAGAVEPPTRADAARRRRGDLRPRW